MAEDGSPWGRQPRPDEGERRREGGGGPHVYGRGRPWPRGYGADVYAGYGDWGGTSRRDPDRDYGLVGPGYAGYGWNRGYGGYGREGREGQDPVPGGHSRDHGREGRGRQYAHVHGRGAFGGGEERGWWERTRDEVASWLGDDGAEQRRLRDHQGRGPRGYRRLDARVLEDVNDQLTDDPYVDASGIGVEVSNGEVTLAGTVDSRSARRRAEDVAEGVPGVTYVQNNLRVRQ